MSRFRTSLSDVKATFNISHKDNLFFIGSCFSTNIHKQLEALKFKTVSNPYGVLFNPFSVAQAIREIIDKEQYDEKDLITYNNLYHSFNHHSTFSSKKVHGIIGKINSSIQEAHQFLQETDYIFITLGSAWAYKYKNQKLVANCHKIPNKEFTKVLLTETEIVSIFEQTLNLLRVFNKNINIIFTVSPVRHLKDGFEENYLSKSVLRAAIYQLQLKNQAISYFPAYELVMDDLRDYRFYNEDMVHPSAVAIDYIFEYFSKRYFTNETEALNSRIKKLNAAMQHRFFDAYAEESKKHQAHIAKEKEVIGEMIKTIRLG